MQSLSDFSFLNTAVKSEEIDSRDIAFDLLPTESKAEVLQFETLLQNLLEEETGDIGDDINIVSVPQAVTGPLDVSTVLPDTESLVGELAINDIDTTTTTLDAKNLVTDTPVNAINTEAPIPSPSSNEIDARGITDRAETSVMDVSIEADISPLNFLKDTEEKVGQDFDYNEASSKTNTLKTSKAPDSVMPAVLSPSLKPQQAPTPTGSIEPAANQVQRNDQKKITVSELTPQKHTAPKTLPQNTAEPAAESLSPAAVVQETKSNITEGTANTATPAEALKSQSIAFPAAAPTPFSPQPQAIPQPMTSSVTNVAPKPHIQTSTMHSVKELQILPDHAWQSSDVELVKSLQKSTMPITAEAPIFNNSAPTVAPGNFTSTIAPQSSTLAAQPSLPIKTTEMIADNMVLEARTGKGVSVRLDPPELGRVFIDFQFDSQRGVTATVKPEFAETGLLLRERTDLLTQTLQNNGFDTVNVEIDMNGDADKNARRQDLEQFAQALEAEAEDMIEFVQEDKPQDRNARPSMSLLSKNIDIMI